MKRVMEDMKDSMRRANYVDNLDHKTDSPFIASIINHPFPSKFKTPTLDSYDGTLTPAIILPLLKQPGIFKVFQRKLCAKPFLPP